MTAPRAELAVLLRPIVPGAVKTRLAAALGSAPAARLYRAFVLDTLRTATAAAAAFTPPLSIRLWIAGDPAHPSLAELPPELPRERQPDGDLGARIHAALARGLRDHGVGLALGTDAPTLPAPYLAQAVAQLSVSPLVLGPSADGGYYLIGARAPADGLASALSAVRWSTRHALADTLRGIARTGLSAALVPPWYDVDTARDLALLRLHLALRPDAAPAAAAIVPGLAAAAVGRPLL